MIPRVRTVRPIIPVDGGLRTFRYEPPKRNGKRAVVKEGVKSRPLSPLERFDREIRTARSYITNPQALQWELDFLQRGRANLVRRLSGHNGAAGRAVKSAKGNGNGASGK